MKLYLVAGLFLIALVAAAEAGSSEVDDVEVNRNLLARLLAALGDEDEGGDKRKREPPTHFPGPGDKREPSIYDSGPHKREPPTHFPGPSVNRNLLARLLAALGDEDEGGDKRKREEPEEPEGKRRYRGSKYGHLARALAALDDEESSSEKRKREEPEEPEGKRENSEEEGGDKRRSQSEENETDQGKRNTGSDGYERWRLQGKRTQLSAVARALAILKRDG